MPLTSDTPPHKHEGACPHAASPTIYFTRPPSDDHGDGACVGTSQWAGTRTGNLNCPTCFGVTCGKTSRRTTRGPRPAGGRWRWGAKRATQVDKHPFTVRVAPIGTVRLEGHAGAAMSRPSVVGITSGTSDVENIVGRDAAVLALKAETTRGDCSWQAGGCGRPLTSRVCRRGCPCVSMSPAGP